MGEIGWDRVSDHGTATLSELLSIVFLARLACVAFDVHGLFGDILLVRGHRPGKPVQLHEHEIKYLCTKAREIFISQPILLELEAPIKICGIYVHILDSICNG